MNNIISNILRKKQQYNEIKDLEHPLMIKIFDLIKDKAEQIIMLKGDWGVGKTYLWKKVEQQLIYKNVIKKEEMLYASLFGIDSVDLVKKKLVASSYQQGIVESFSDVMSDIEKLGGGNISSKAISGMSSLLYNYYEENKLKNKILILDDIERKDEKLDSIKLLGMVNELKDKKNIIILLVNEDKIKEENWQEFKEKVIDIELLLSPSKNEFMDIIKLKNPFIKEDMILTKILHDFNLSNIRMTELIIKKTQSFRKIISSNDDDYYVYIKSVFCVWWLYYTKFENISLKNLLIYLKKYPEGFVSKQRREKYIKSNLIEGDTIEYNLVTSFLNQHDFIKMEPSFFKLIEKQLIYGFVSDCEIEQWYKDNSPFKTLNMLERKLYFSLDKNTDFWLEKIVDILEENLNEDYLSYSTKFFELSSDLQKDIFIEKFKAIKDNILKTINKNIEIISFSEFLEHYVDEKFMELFYLEMYCFKDVKKFIKYDLNDVNVGKFYKFLAHMKNENHFIFYKIIEIIYSINHVRLIEILTINDLL
jgi:hypothetical protein